LSRICEGFYRKILDLVFPLFRLRKTGRENYGNDFILGHGLYEHFFSKLPKLVLKIYRFITIDSFNLILSVFSLHFLFLFSNIIIFNLDQLCLNYSHISLIFLPPIPIFPKTIHFNSTTISQILYNHKSKKH
jgi:hypothetical protein